MGEAGAEVCEFRTDRLSVGPWHVMADRLEIDLADLVSEMLTHRTTEALPASWRGELSAESARVWISERDAESSTSLIVESVSRQPVGLLILAAVPLHGSGVDVRIGYLFAENSWGNGLATEMLSGLVDWARTRPMIRTLTGGTDPENGASRRVLEKCGFTSIDDPDAATAMYTIAISSSNG